MYTYMILIGSPYVYIYIYTYLLYSTYVYIYINIFTLYTYYECLENQNLNLRAGKKNTIFQVEDIDTYCVNTERSPMPAGHLYPCTHDWLM
jgi:hypothetical protein